MASEKTIIVGPEPVIAAVIGASGTAKLAGAEFTKQNFKRWGYADWWRPAIGVVEVGTAAAALLGMRSGAARKAAAICTLATMGGAIATHTIHSEPKYTLIPPLLLATLAVASLYDVTSKAAATAAATQLE
jgi:hypothetical protein